MQRDGPTGHVGDEIRARLGISRIGGRREIRSAAPVENGLRLDLGDEAVTLTDIVPAKRLPDLLADLLRRPADQT